MDSQTSNDLNDIRQKLIRTLEHVHNEKQLNEIDSLINFYFQKKLDDAITKAEAQNDFTAATYGQWLNEQRA